jgi:DNA polymerase III delta subunit
MLYFIFGTDKDRARKKAISMVEALQKKKPDASFFKIDAEHANLSDLDEYIGGQGLFENKYIVLFDGVFEVKEMREEIMKRLPDLNHSQNIFIFREDELDKSSIGKITKHSTQVQEFSLIEKENNKKEFNVFQLTDALGTFNKKTLWTLFWQAKESGVEDEQIHGILFWQVKSLLITENSLNAKEAGLNPFVFDKSKKFLQNFTKEKLLSMSQGLVDVYHLARRGEYTLEVGLEKWILDL